MTTQSHDLATAAPAATVTYTCPGWCESNSDPRHGIWDEETPYGRVVRWHWRRIIRDEDVYVQQPEFADAPGATEPLTALLIDPPEDEMSAADLRQMAAGLIEAAEFIEAHQ